MARRTAFFTVTFALLVGFLFGGTVVAVGATADPCASKFSSKTIAKLKAYTACRDDRQDAALKRIESKLDKLGATPPPSESSPSPTAGSSAGAVRNSIVNLPGRPALTAYGSATAARAYQHPGALIISGRDNFDATEMKDASKAGATVLVYLDIVIDNSYGRYHKLLDDASACGPATSRWPGQPKANQWGYLQDFRKGSVVQSKLHCVLEQIVADNPHIGGFFADDLGSRSWFPGFDWSSWGTSNQRAYRDGAVAAAETFHEVAAEHGLAFLVNGTWTAGSLATNGGGYPAVNAHGLSLADGGYIEHHATSELGYWTSYAKGQWGTAKNSVSQGKPFMYVQAMDDATRDAYNKAKVFAFLSAQSDYDTASVWGPFTPTGLPSHVSR